MGMAKIFGGSAENAYKQAAMLLVIVAIYEAIDVSLNQIDYKELYSSYTHYNI